MITRRDERNTIKEATDELNRVTTELTNAKRKLSEIENAMFELAERIDLALNAREGAIDRQLICEAASADLDRLRKGLPPTQVEGLML